MKTFALAALAAASAGTASASFCDLVNGALPSEVTCTASHGSSDGFVLTYSQDIKIASETLGVTTTYFDTTVSGTFSVKPCATAASMAVSLTNTKPAASLSKSISSGDTTDIPIPGASNAGVGINAAVGIKGSISAFELDLGITLCDGPTKCGTAVPILSDIPGYPFPISLLKKTVDFTDACKSTAGNSGSSLSPGLWTMALSAGAAAMM